MIASILFLACAPQSAFDAPDDVTAEESALARSVTVEVSVKDPSATSVAITHVTWSVDEMVVGAEMVSGPVVDGVATVSIPARVPRRDRNVNKPTALVTYVVTARNADGAYVAVSDSTVVYAPRAVEGGPSRGWNVLVDRTDTEAEWASVGDGVDVEHSLVGSASVEVGGTVSVEYDPSQRIASVPLSESTITPYDEPFQTSWHISVGGQPTADQIGGWGKAAGVAAFEPVLYADSDASLSYSDTDRVDGHVCIGPITAGIAWVPAPWTVADAMSYAEKSQTAGWTLFDLGAEGFSVVEAEGSDAAIRASCEDGKDDDQ